jgi:hypothetical protein
MMFCLDSSAYIFFETKACFALLLIKKKVPNLLMENRAKTIDNTTGPCPHDTTGPSPRSKNTEAQTRKTPLRQAEATNHHHWREDAETTMGGADAGRSSNDEEANPSRSTPKLRGRRLDILYSATPNKPPTPSSGTAVPTYHRSHSSHDAAQLGHPQPKLHRVNCSQTTVVTPKSRATAPA